MLSRIAPVVVFSAVLSGALVVMATTYTWNSKVKPPIDLPSAHAKARAALPDKDDWYCIDATLNGNATGMSHPAAWVMRFAKVNGEQKQVAVRVARGGTISTTVDDYLPKEPDLKKPARNLDALQARLREFVRHHALSAKLARNGGELTLTYRSRSFITHELLESGEFSTKTREIVGPKKDGIVVKIREREAAAVSFEIRRFFDYAVYFSRVKAIGPSDNKGKEIVCEVDSGSDCNHELVDRLLVALGVVNGNTD